MLRDVAMKNGLYRPAQLLQPIVEYIDHGTTDLLWLQKKYGLVFNGIDYEKIAPQDAIALPEGELAVSDLFTIDRRVQDRLNALIIDQLLAQQRKREIRKSAKP
jgi:hypothetical protein